MLDHNEKESLGFKTFLWRKDGAEYEAKAAKLS